MLNKIKFFQGYIFVFGSAILSVIILQLLIFPKIFHDYSEIYTTFLQHYYNYSITAILLNTIAFYQYKKYDTNYLLFFIFFIFFILYLILFNNDVNIIIFGISIFFYEIIKNILRIKNQDLVLGIIFPLNMLLIYVSLNFSNPYIAHIYINSILSLGIFFYYKVYVFTIVKIPIKKVFYNSLEIILNILNKDLDKILVLNFLLYKESNTLTFIIVFGLILMPIQLLGKYIVTEDRYKMLFNIKKITFFVLILAVISSVVSIIIIKYLYHIDVGNYTSIIILIIITKVVYSIGYLLFSKQENEFNIQLVVIKFMLLIILFCLVYFINVNLESLLLCYLVYMILFYTIDYGYYKGYKL